ncbi:MAG: hypothetical protein HON23_03610 [Rickettsiales bacterium]|jgi:hypothetical protein|nr:hypothetical protein [Rickettsiales bacterium]
MKKTFNLASTDKISKSQLDAIVKGVAASAKKKALLARKKLDQEIKQGMQDAQKRARK